MDSTPTSHTRRGILKSACVGLGLAGLTVPVQAGPPEDGPNGNGTTGGKTPLLDGVAEFKLYVGRADDGPDEPDEPGAFGYPERPRIASEDPVGGLFDAGNIEKTPNGQTLHHTFEFFQGLLISTKKAKPYVLRHEGDGRFVSEGQHVNFEARTSRELRALFEKAEVDPALADREPLATLAGGQWRAVGNDIVQFLGDPERSRRLHSSVTRVDFYSRGGGPLEYELSALYVIYPNVDEDGQPTPADPTDPTLRPIPPTTRRFGTELITDGRSNPGGQP